MWLLDILNLINEFEHSKQSTLKQKPLLNLYNAYIDSMWLKRVTWTQYISVHPAWLRCVFSKLWIKSHTPSSHLSWDSNPQHWCEAKDTLPLHHSCFTCPIFNTKVIISISEIPQCNWFRLTILYIIQSSHSEPYLLTFKFSISNKIMFWWKTLCFFLNLTIYIPSWLFCCTIFSLMRYNLFTI